VKPSDLVVARGLGMNRLTLQLRHRDLSGHNPAKNTDFTKTGDTGLASIHILSLFKFPQASQDLGQSFRQPAQIHSLFNFLPLVATPQRPPNPSQFTHSSTSPHKWKSQRQLTHSSTFPSTRQAGRVGRRKQSPSPVEELVQSFHKSTLAFPKPAPIARTDTV